MAKIGAIAAKNSYRQSMEPGERVVARIRKHIIGLIVVYLQIVIGVAALIALPVMIAPDLLSSGSDYGIIGSALGLLIIVTVLIVILATSVYRQSQLVLTDQSLIQTLQHAIFNKKVSRLALSDIEDVTYEQKGVVQTMVNYGTLHIETAGELKNFAFKYCPNPEKFAILILDARQKFTNGLND